MQKRFQIEKIQILRVFVRCYGFFARFKLLKKGSMAGTRKRSKGEEGNGSKRPKRKLTEDSLLNDAMVNVNKTTVLKTRNKGSKKGADRKAEMQSEENLKPEDYPQDDARDHSQQSKKTTRKPYGFMQSSFWVIMMVHVMVCGDL